MIEIIVAIVVAFFIISTIGIWLVPLLKAAVVIIAVGSFAAFIFLILVVASSV